MLACLATALAAPSATELAAAWEARRAALDAGAAYPFRFTADEWVEVARGGVAKRRERLAGTDRVLGVRWVDADLDTTWLAVQDPHGVPPVRGFVEEELPGSTHDRRLVYQRIELPWPLQARQWVITVANNLPLIRATQGELWERTWTLTDARGARAELTDAVWLPVNEGGWFLAAAGPGTLLGYHVRSSVGGIVPDEAATRWSFATLAGMLETVAARVSYVREHYVAGHAPMRRPDGTEIPPYAP